MPKDFGGCSASLALGATAITATCTTSTGIYHIKPATDLSANTWYTLSLTLGDAAKSEAASVLAVPIKMATTSSATISSGDDW